VPAELLANDFNLPGRYSLDIHLWVKAATSAFSLR
jgi:hypothetical protein